jgi:F-type H+-transporting ATPase subunit epsilon
MPIHVELVTQEKKIFDEPQADMVLIPATEGEMGVLPNHAPVLTTLGFGELIIRKGKAEERFAIYGGVVDVRPDKVVILADLAESSFDLDLAAAEKARESAAEMMTKGVPEAMNRRATLELRRAELSLRIHRKIQSSGPIMRIIEDDNDK